MILLIADTAWAFLTADFLTAVLTFLVIPALIASRFDHVSHQYGHDSTGGFATPSVRNGVRIIKNNFMVEHKAAKPLLYNNSANARSNSLVRFIYQIYEVNKDASNTKIIASYCPLALLLHV